LKVLKGEAPVALSRLPTAWLTEGFFVWKDGGPHLVQNRTLHDTSNLLARRIRGGHRPAIEVYWSVINPAPQKYVCPDAEAILLGYRQAGVAEVPVRILDYEKDRLHESAVCIFETGPREGFFHTVALDRDQYGSLIGRRRFRPSTAMSFLSRHCATLEQCVAAFHEPFDDISYHDTVRMQISRHRQILESMEILLRQGRIDHCFALVRLLYEGFLNHYLDWLSPEIFGPRLAGLAEFRRLQAQRRSAGETCPDDAIRDALRGLMPLLETVEQKARLSPLGSLFYRIAYPSLSFVVHQDYGEKAASLDQDTVRHNERVRGQSIVRWSDAITGALFRTIRADFGHPAAPTVETA
jgi:hypothetical protein